MIGLYSFVYPHDASITPHGDLIKVAKQCFPIHLASHSLLLSHTHNTGLPRDPVGLCVPLPRADYDEPLGPEEGQQRGALSAV